MKKNSLQPTWLLMFPILGVIGCDTGERHTSSQDSVHGIELKYMDTTVSPKTDFYSYVNGTWQKQTDIPNDRSRWGSFDELRKNTDKDAIKILEQLQKHNTYAADSDQSKVVYLYRSYLDSVAREKEGVAPIVPLIKKIESIKDIASLQEILSSNPIEISNPFFGLGVYSSPSDSNKNVLYLSTGSLGLPDRDYYVSNDSAMVDIRKKYTQHIARMLQFLGYDQAISSEKANRIVKIETELARPKLDKVASRDFRNFNNPMSVSQLQKLVPAIQWNAYFQKIGITEDIDSLLVMQPKYMTELEHLLKTTDISTIQDLLVWSTFRGVASELTPEIETANWEFYGKTLQGLQQQKPKNERALAVVNAALGEALGQIYVQEKFPPEAKEKAKEMISNIIEAYRERIKKLDWMSNSTKDKAIEKLDKFTIKVGYPDKWEDYSKVDITANNSYYQNMLAVSDWAFKKELSEINKPVDKNKWGMSPQTVNAYFNPFFNEIVFPAAILQPPFYDYKADEAVNYGGIGAVIGHEISHAFDDSGARFDANGNLSNWWTDKDLEQFTERGKKLVDQYNKLEVLKGVFVNGAFTLGENIGDLGGVLSAFDGLNRYFKQHGRPDKIDGFTPEQRFFISWATVWRTKSRDEALRNQVTTDPHTPGMFRAYVPLQNVDDFYKAFDIQPGDKMYVAPEDRVRIW